MDAPGSGSGARTGRRALLRYVVGWAGAGVALVVVAVVALGGDGGTGGDARDDAASRPVQEVELAAAVRNAGCVLPPTGRAAPGLPVAGPPARPARPGVYSEALPAAALVGALRRGVVVIHHRPELPAAEVARLVTVRRAVPSGTIVVPNATMRFAVAVTAWRQLLGCPAPGRRAVDAVRLFRVRFIGAGPDVAP